MENLQAITSFFASIWSLFTSINHPLLGIPLSVIYMGVFAIAISVMFLRPILGIGVGAIGDISKRARAKNQQINERYENMQREKYNNSYEKYKNSRMRAEAYARRYNKETRK